MPQLILRQGLLRETFELSQHTRIGRLTENDITIKDDLISRYHAEIIQAEDGYLFKDLNSSNGSFNRGVRIYEKMLNDGDIITMGENIVLTFIHKQSDQQSSQVYITSKPIPAHAIQARAAMEQGEAFLPASHINGDNWQEDYEKLRLGNELLQKLDMHHDLNQNMQNIATKLLEIFPADRCAILLMDAKTGNLFPMTVKLQPGIKGPLSISRSIADEVQKTYSALLVADVREDQQFSISNSLLLQEVHSVLCAPIIYDNNFYGIIHMDSQKPAMVFSKQDLHLLVSLSKHIATVAANTKLIQSLEKDARDKAQLARLVPPSVIQKIQVGEIKLDQKGGSLKEVTILFADIRGFTNIAHNASATTVVDMLNHYFELIVNVVFQYGGTVDKFIGDEVMVLFGALTDIKFAEDRAIRCAFMMHGVLEQMNRERIERDEPPLEIGIGINTGVVVVGAIGSSQSMQYTCIGDAVNIASRLTSKAKAKQTIISEETFKRLNQKPKYEQLPDEPLKGIDRPVKMYSIWENTTDTIQHFIGH